jgi:hypothetical protein
MNTRWRRRIRSPSIPKGGWGGLNKEKEEVVVSCGCSKEENEQSKKRARQGLVAYSGLGRNIWLLPPVKVSSLAT